MASDSLKGFHNHLLDCSSKPETTTRQVLRLVLKQALKLSDSDAGGALFVFEPNLGGNSSLAASVFTGVRLGYACRSADLEDKAFSPIPIVRSSGKALRISSHSGPDAHPPLQQRADSSLWIPFVEGRRQVMGIVQVASTKPDSFTDQHIQRLTALASKAIAGINRILLRERLAKAGLRQEVVGISSVFCALERQIKGSAHFLDGPVLITGERGTGKELAAWSVHCWSARRSQSFVPVLASAFSEGLVSDELFGHEKHAFTGASRHRPGKFGAADGGSIFLDEVADLPSAVQATLLRIIDKGELPRIGRDLPIRVNVRVIAATNRNLPQMLRSGGFREDLYDRLNVFRIRIPPLRSRKEDIPPLASTFMRKHCKRISRGSLLEREGVCTACGGACSIPCAERGFFDVLQSYHWPGNIRELENLIASLVAQVPDGILRVEHLPRRILESNGRPSAEAIPESEEGLTLDGAIKRHLEKVLALAGNNQTKAAQMLQVPLSTMRNKMKKLGVEIRSAKPQ